MTRSPAELGIDLMSGEFFGNDPYPAFAWMRRQTSSAASSRCP
jgi:hypothetical protein